MRRNAVIPIVGIHLAGKSMVLEHLAQRGFVTESELAEKIRVRDSKLAGEKGDINFDISVANEEIRRDQQREYDVQVCFIESWHILTMAYMLTRGMKIESLKSYFEYIEIYKQSHDVYCIFLDATAEMLKTRVSRLHSPDEYKGICAFYNTLNNNIQIVLKNLNIKYFLIKASDSKKCVCEEVDKITEKMLLAENRENE